MAPVWRPHDLEESFDDTCDNSSTKESVDDICDNASTKDSVDDLTDSFQTTGELVSATATDATAAEELIKIIGPPPGLEGLVQDFGHSKLDLTSAKDNYYNQYGSEESTTDASISGDEKLIPARPPGKLGPPPGDLRKLLNFTPLPHEQVVDAMAPENHMPMMVEFGMAAEASAEMMYSSSQRCTRAHHRPRVKKEGSTDHPFAPLARSTRAKASAPSNETGSRTKLRSSAKMFQPLPFMPMSSVQAAWNRWEHMTPGMHGPESWQQPYGYQSWATSAQ